MIVSGNNCRSRSFMHLPVRLQPPNTGDGRNNTYACVRTLTADASEIYCEFNDDEHFVEWYNLTADPYNMHNLAPSASPEALAEQHKTLLKHQACSGQDCFL